jgi:hypothetical protein
MIEMCGDGIMALQHVKKWCREFENSQVDIRDNQESLIYPVTDFKTPAGVGRIHQCSWGIILKIMILWWEK